MATNLFIRSAHDVALAIWFGERLVSATSRHDADGTSDVRPSADRVAPVAPPLLATAIATYLATGVGLSVVNRRRLVAQRGVASVSLAKTAITGLALASTAISIARPANPARSGPTTHEPRRTDAPRRAAVRWSGVIATGALIVLTSVLGEQQRPTEVGRGVLRRLRPTT